MKAYLCVMLFLQTFAFISRACDLSKSDEALARKLAREKLPQEERRVSAVVMPITAALLVWGSVLLLGR